MIGSRAELLSLFRPWLLILPWGLMSIAWSFIAGIYLGETDRPALNSVFVVLSVLGVLFVMGWKGKKPRAKSRQFRLPWFKPHFMWLENDGALNPFQYIWRFLLAFSLPFAMTIEMSMFYLTVVEGTVENGVPVVGTAFFALISAPIAFMFWEESRRRARDRETQAE